jgi:hypothetical protein
MLLVVGIEYEREGVADMGADTDKEVGAVICMFVVVELGTS